eukprot:2183651-Prymnesium_polylepis.1
MLLHWCALWCARVPAGWMESQSASHTENNGRCDYLYHTVRDHVRTTTVSKIDNGSDIGANTSHWRQYQALAPIPELTIDPATSL